MRFDSSGRELFDLKLKSDIFAKELKKQCNWFGCVPDSVFKNTLPHLNNWQLAPRENHLVGMAFGAKLAGLKPAILIQNSGLGLCLDSLLGTFGLYNQGLLLVISNRGVLDWEETQHKEWGDITIPLLRLSKIQLISLDEEGLNGLNLASKIAFQDNKIVALVIQRGNLDE